jgi:hypothetical protein
MRKAENFRNQVMPRIIMKTLLPKLPAVLLDNAKGQLGYGID